MYTAACQTLITESNKLQLLCFNLTLVDVNLDSRVTLKQNQLKP